MHCNGPIINLVYRIIGLLCCAIKGIHGHETPIHCARLDIAGQYHAESTIPSNGC